MEAKRLSKLLKAKHLFSNIEVWRLVGSIPCGAWSWSLHSLKRGRYLWIEIASRTFGCEKAPQKIPPRSHTQSSHPLSSICFTFAFPNFGSLGIFLASDHILLFWNPLNRPSSRLNPACLIDGYIFVNGRLERSIILVMDMEFVGKASQTCWAVYVNRRLFKVVCDLLSRKLLNHFEKQHTDLKKAEEI